MALELACAHTLVSPQLSALPLALTALALSVALLSQWEKACIVVETVSGQEHFASVALVSGALTCFVLEPELHPIHWCPYL